MVLELQAMAGLFGFCMLLLVAAAITSRKATPNARNKQLARAVARWSREWSAGQTDPTFPLPCSLGEYIDWRLNNLDVSGDYHC